MKRILLLSILCPQFVAGICWGGDGLDTWTVRTNSLSSTNWLYDIAFSNDQFVAVGGSQIPSFGGWFHGAGVITTSADGTNWFQKTIPSGTGTLVGLTHAAGFYVAVGNGTVLTSLAGTSWTPSTSLSFNSSAVAYGNGVFVAAAGPQVYVSTNANNWTRYLLFFEGAFSSIAYGKGQFLAAGTHGGIMASTDGVAWIVRSDPGFLPVSVFYGNGAFIAAGRGGAFATSTDDGITWTKRDSGTRSNLLGAAYGGGVFVMVGTGGTILTSPDGTAWIVRPSGVTNDLTAVAYGNGHFVAVGSSGVILESGPVIHLGLPKVLSPGAVQFTLTGPVGQLCQIRTSTDFANWVALTEIMLAEPSTTLVIISSNRPSSLFYQIAAP